MKKQYSKPGIIIEDFTISQNISSGCGVPGGGGPLGKPAHWSKETCAWDMGNITVFLDTMKVCEDIQLGPDDEFEGICYNNPEGGATIFSS